MRLWPRLVGWMFRLLCLPHVNTSFMTSPSLGSLSPPFFPSSSLIQQSELSCFWKCAGAAALFSGKEAAKTDIETDTEIVLCSCLCHIQTFYAALINLHCAASRHLNSCDLSCRVWTVFEQLASETSHMVPHCPSFFSLGLIDVRINSRHEL